jgi:sugar/nucleoside kinase (ribokinase family)
VSIEYDYIAIGHVTRDVIEDASGGPREQPGGSAFYSALQASRLGLRALIVTRGAQREIDALLAPYLDELEVDVQASEQTTTLVTRGSGAQRVQHVRAWAGPIEMPSGELGAKVVHLAPVAREVSAWRPGEGSFVGITPQGLARRWNADGRVSQAPLDLRSLPERFDAAVINERELAGCAGLFELASTMQRRPPIAITAGSRPIRLHLQEGTVEAIDPIAVPAVRDDLGAGDVFAATFFISLAEGKPATEAARVGSTAAALRVAAAGPGAVADASAIAAAT